MPNYSKTKLLIKTFILVLIIVLISSSIQGKGNDKKLIESWKLQYQVTSFYDNNILKYSDKYLQRYNDNEDFGRFHINSLSDLVLVNSFKGSATLSIFRKLKSIAALHVMYKNYTKNSIKNFWGFEIGWRQYLSRRTSFNIAYSLTPNFYVRHYRDEDLVRELGYTAETFRPFEFSKNDISLWFRNYFYKNTQTTFYFSYFWYSHSPDFTEYNSSNILLGFKAKQKLLPKFSVYGGYKFINSKARGFDEPGETKENSDDVDASFSEHIFMIGGKYEFPDIVGKSNSIELATIYHKRVYSTTKSLDFDPMHSGRADDVLILDAQYNIQIIEMLETGIFFNWNFRNSDTGINENNPLVSIEKKYDQFLFGLEFKLKLEISNN